MENRRIKLTKQMIMDSFIELLKEKSITEISVKELCEKADVNRTTFYNYYEDQYELLSIVEEKFIWEINMILVNYGFLDDNCSDRDKMVEEILVFLKNNKLLFLSLFQSYDIPFIKQVVKILSDPFFMTLDARKKFGRKEREYGLYFLSYGILNVIHKWVSSDEKTSPKELVRILIQIVEQ